MLLGVRTMSSTQVWKQLDGMSRGLFIPGYDGWWPNIGEVFELRKQLSSEMYKYIHWPIDDMTFQKSVIQAPVITAAFFMKGYKLVKINVLLYSQQGIFILLRLLHYLEQHKQCYG